MIDADAGPAPDHAAVLIDFANDLESVVALQAAIDAGPPRTAIFAQIACPAFRARVDDNLDKRGGPDRPRVFGRSHVTAQRLVDTQCFSELAFWRGQDRLHAVVVGWGPLGRACFEALIMSGFALGLRRPRVTIIVDDTHAVRQEIASDCPEIEASADVSVLDLGRDGGRAGLGASLAEAGAVPLTAVILALPYLEALALAARIEADWIVTGTSPASLHIVTDELLPALGAWQENSNDLARRITTTCSVQASDLVAWLRDEDGLARRLQTAYAERFAGPTPRSWEALPETLRRANRAAAAHLPHKLRTIGLEPGSDPDVTAVEPRTLQALKDALINPTGEDAVVRRLARFEHERWCAERRLDGWRSDPVRDDARKRHPDLVSFDDPRLGAAEITKDTAQVRFLLGSVLRPSENGWAFPVVVAVRAGLSTPPAIGLGAALALLLREPWRPVTLLCALIDKAEVEAVRSLLARCNDQARRWRLIVPEYGSSRRNGAAADLLALSSTIIAPLNLASASAEPGWVDPTRPDGAEAEYRAYLASRATALIACDA